MIKFKSKSTSRVVVHDYFLASRATLLLFFTGGSALRREPPFLWLLASTFFCSVVYELSDFSYCFSIDSRQARSAFTCSFDSISAPSCTHRSMRFSSMFS